MVALIEVTITSLMKSPLIEVIITSPINEQMVEANGTFYDQTLSTLYFLDEFTLHISLLP